VPTDATPRLAAPEYLAVPRLGAAAGDIPICETEGLIMRALRDIAKEIPVIPYMYRALRNMYFRYQLKSRGTQGVFTETYRSNRFGGKDSVSGPGSDVDQTRIVISTLPALFNELSISTMLDIPCGDFHWMKSVNLNRVHYTGADIVEDLIQKNTEKYARGGVRFQYLNLITDKLPKVDLIFCRDCLVHLSFAHIFLVLDNVCNSQSTYFLTTTFTGRKDNHDIVTGQWRVLNLEVVPFALPKPHRIISEGCTECHGAYDDKALGLWRIEDLRESLWAATMRSLPLLA
jgi:hypothetical protein